MPVIPRGAPVGVDRDRSPALSGIGAAVGAIPPAHPAGRLWWSAFALALALIGLCALAGLHAGDPAAFAVGEAGVPAIGGAAYAWWIGIACGSLLVSSVLLLLGAEWRSAISRVAETVALLAALAAAFSLVVDPGRSGLLAGSALPLGALDTGSLLTVCFSLWSVRLLPDLATLRDRTLTEAQHRSPARGLARLRAGAYGILACGWRGSAAHWHVWIEACRALALLGVLLAVTVLTGAALAGLQSPAWHGALLPVRFLVDAAASGVGVTAAVVVTARHAYGLNAVVTVHHLDVLGRLMLCLACAGAYCSAAEAFDAALAGPLAAARPATAWIAASCLVVPAQALWSARARAAPMVIAAVGLLFAGGAYVDHVGVLATAPARVPPPAVPPSSLADASGWPALAGSLGLFLALLLLCLRYLPAVSIVEIRCLDSVGDPDVERPVPVAADARRGPCPDGAPLWGVAASFTGPADLAAALNALSGMTPADVRLDGHGPVPLPRALRALGLEGGSVVPYALAGAAVGAAACLGVGLRLDGQEASLIAGRPDLRWTALLVPSAACAMTGGCLAVCAALLTLNRLPDLGHPALAIPGFLRASADRFFLTAEARGAGFDPDRIEARLARLPRQAGRPLDIRRIPR